MTESIASQLQAWQWVAILTARASVGLLFALSGYGKLFVPARRAQMRETVKAAGVPFPEINATVVSFIEFLCGVFLVVGFLTSICAALLVGVMTVALTTTVLPGMKAESLPDWLGEFFYLPEVLYIIVLFWLFLSGAGKFSVDALLFAAR